MSLKSKVSSDNLIVTLDESSPKAHPTIIPGKNKPEGIIVPYVMLINKNQTNPNSII